jgi:hypothetical protein
MWDNATAISWYKNRIDCWLNGFGEHTSVYAIDLGNEFMFTSDEADFQDWVDEMSEYLWDNYGSHKPYITVSTADNTWADSENDAFGRLYGNARMVTWHNYNTHYTLNQIKGYIDDFRATDVTFTPTTQDYTVEIKKFFFRVGENWGFGTGPSKVPDEITDINIQGEPDPVNSYAYEDPPDDTVAPYPHERMYAFLSMVLDPSMHYNRWDSWIDGLGSTKNAVVSCQKIMKVAKDFLDTCPFVDTGLDMNRHEDNISTDGAFDFKAALKLENIVVTFVLVGSGNQTIDFGITGAWTLVTYKWEGDGADDWERVEDDTAVPDASSYLLAFGDYTDGFCPGYLVSDTSYRNLVETTITTEVVVEVN